MVAGEDSAGETPFDFEKMEPQIGAAEQAQELDQMETAEIYTLFYQGGDLRIERLRQHLIETEDHITPEAATMVREIMEIEMEEQVRLTQFDRPK